MELRKRLLRLARARLANRAAALAAFELELLVGSPRWDAALQVVEFRESLSGLGAVLGRAVYDEDSVDRELLRLVDEWAAERERSPKPLPAPLPVSGTIVRAVHRNDFALRPASEMPALPVRVPAHRAQEQAILRWLTEVRCDPLALPRPQRGKPGIKAAAMGALGFSKDVMNKAWQRLRRDGRIADAH